MPAALPRGAGRPAAARREAQAREATARVVSLGGAAIPVTRSDSLAVPPRWMSQLDEPVGKNAVNLLW
jgi:hypothetical protein